VFEAGDMRVSLVSRFPLARIDGGVAVEFTLAPGESTTGTATYDLTDEDIASGTVPNTATVTGQDEDGTEVSDTDDETISIVVVDPAQLAPSISVVKDAVDGVADDGEGNLLVTITGEDGTATVTYRYVVTNTGDDDLTDLTLVDDKIGDLTDELVAAVTAEYGAPVLPVDGQVTITAPHEVSADDFDGITLTNLVDVTGLGVDSGATVTDDDTETVVLIQVLDTTEEAEEEDRTPSTQLPKTGLDTAGLTGLGLLLAAIGAGALLFTRRRTDTA
jgi:LPXTG-motif cell wall-anchored protein